MLRHNCSQNRAISNQTTVLNHPKQAEAIQLFLTLTMTKTKKKQASKPMPSAEQDTKMSPKVNKDVPVKRSSPAKGRKSRKEIKVTKTKSGWHVLIKVFQGDIVGIMIVKTNQIDDAYNKPIKDAIQCNNNEIIEGLGIMYAADMKIGLDNENDLTGTDGWTKKMCIMPVDEDETTEEELYAKCLELKKFLELPENNKYKTPVHVVNPGFNRTPPHPAPLPKLSEAIKHQDLVAIIKELFNGVDHTWAANNKEAAMCFFHKGHIPEAAVVDLGFEESEVGPISEEHVRNEGSPEEDINGQAPQDAVDGANN